MGLNYSNSRANFFLVAAVQYSKVSCITTLRESSSTDSRGVDFECGLYEMVSIHQMSTLSANVMSIT